MAKFPVYQRQVGLQGGSTASYASDGAFTAPARALAAGGGDIADVGKSITAIGDKIRQSQEDTWFTKARADTQLDMINVEQESRKAATDGAPNYTAGMSQRFADYRKEKIAGAPSPRAARMYNEFADSYSVDVTGRAARFQAESELAKRTTDFTDAMNAHAQAIYADPSQFDAVYKRAMDDFEGAKQWMTPEQEQVAREKVEHDLKLSRAKSLVDFSPADFQREVAGSDPASYREAISSIESGGRYDAVGPTHPTMGRALGKYQVMEANITRWSKDAIGRAVTSEEFLASPQIQDAIFDHVFGGYVKRFGPEGAAQAWFAGPGGVGKTGRKDSLGTDVGTYGQKFMKALGAKGVPSDPRFAGLSVDEIRSLSTQADQAVNAERAAYYNQMKDSMELGIATGQVISEDQILGSDLGDGDKATLLGKFRTRNEEVGQLTADLAALSDGSLTLDPYSSKDKARADNLYSEILKKAGDEGAVAVAAGVLEQTGVVPQPIINAIRKGLDSRNPQDFVSAVQTASRVSQLDPAALGRRDGGNEVQKAADDFSHYVNRLNLSPEDAAKRMIDDRNPEKKFDRKALEPAAKEFVKTLEGEDVGAVFDDSMLGWRSNPAIGFDPGQALGIKAEYLAIAEDQFYAANGNPEIAKNRAAEEMKRLYGVTEITGSPVVMKHPPERYWPAFDAQRLRINEVAKKYGGAPTEEGPLTYREQLQADILELDEAADLGSVQLVTTPETDAMIKRGEMPGYGVLYKDKNGNLQTIPGKLWLPEFSRLEGIQREDDARREKDSREYRERTREKIRIREQNREANPLALPGVN